MKSIEYKTTQGNIETALIVKRIDKNLFSCKSNARKRNSDLLIHIDLILTDVSNVTFEDPKTETGGAYFNTDEFDGLCQSNQIGENPFRASIMCSNPKLNEVN